MDATRLTNTPNKPTQIEIYAILTLKCILVHRMFRRKQNFCAFKYLTYWFFTWSEILVLAQIISLINFLRALVIDAALKHGYRNINEFDIANNVRKIFSRGRKWTPGSIWGSVPLIVSRIASGTRAIDRSEDIM